MRLYYADGLRIEINRCIDLIHYYNQNPFPVNFLKVIFLKYDVAKAIECITLSQNDIRIVYCYQRLKNWK